MNNHQTTSLFARMALVFALLLSTACATVNTAPVEEKVGPQAPGGSFDTEAPAPGPAPAAATTAAAAPQTPSAETTPAPGRITPRQKYVNVRPEPSTSNKPVAVLMGGKKVEVLAREGGWVKIRWTRGKKTLEGWVAGKFVETDTPKP
ncbi:SH3 domain-containing protein [Geobacter sp.]|uniref:SH3 domain-containing protein n=1 Tax=Geobacter sp. TaxID=46610 RepID=UPI0027B9357B|nr:SH3 domain-containing protein [Geobacter sp.]